MPYFHSNIASMKSFFIISMKLVEKVVHGGNPYDSFMCKIVSYIKSIKLMRSEN